MFDIEYYEDSSGNRPAEEFIDSLDVSNITRILYFFVVGERVIITHGFVKKTKKTPSREIAKAKRIREDWRNRNE